MSYFFFSWYWDEKPIGVFLAVDLGALELDGPGKVPSIRNLVTLRKDVNGIDWNEHYMYFCDKFLRCVVGLQTYKRQWRLVNCRLSDIVTESDEAMALLLLENNEQKWLDEYLESHAVSKEQEGNKATINRKEEDNNNCHQKRKLSTNSNKTATRYTSAGDNSNKKGFTKKYGGWSTAGIYRYNQLTEMVSNDRDKNGGAFDFAFRKYHDTQNEEEALGNSNGSNKQPPSLGEPTVRATNNLAKILGLSSQQEAGVQGAAETRQWFEHQQQQEWHRADEDAEYCRPGGGGRGNDNCLWSGAAAV